MARISLFYHQIDQDKKHSTDFDLIFLADRQYFRENGAIRPQLAAPNFARGAHKIYFWDFYVGIFLRIYLRARRQITICLAELISANRQYFHENVAGLLKISNYICGMLFIPINFMVKRPDRAISKLTEKHIIVILLFRFQIIFGLAARRFCNMPHILVYNLMCLDIKVVAPMSQGRRTLQSPNSQQVYYYAVFGVFRLTSSSRVRNVSKKPN